MRALVNREFNFVIAIQLVLLHKSKFTVCRMIQNFVEIPRT